MVAWVSHSAPLLQESIAVKHHPPSYAGAEVVSNTSVQRVLSCIKNTAAVRDNVGYICRVIVQSLKYNTLLICLIRLLYWEANGLADSYL